MFLKIKSTEKMIAIVQCWPFKYMIYVQGRSEFFEYILTVIREELWMKLQGEGVLKNLIICHFSFIILVYLILNFKYLSNIRIPKFINCIHTEYILNKH